MPCRHGSSWPWHGGVRGRGGAPRRRGAGSSHERGLPAACLSTPPSAHPRSGGSDGGRRLELLPEHGRSACRAPGHLRAGDTSTPGAPAVAVTHEGRRRCPRPGHLPMGRASPRRQHGARAPQPRPSQAHTLCPRQGPGLLGDGVGSRTSSACRWGQFLFVTVGQTDSVISSPVSGQHVSQGAAVRLRRGQNSPPGPSLLPLPHGTVPSGSRPAPCLWCTRRWPTWSQEGGLAEAEAPGACGWGSGRGTVLPTNAAGKSRVKLSRHVLAKSRTTRPFPKRQLHPGVALFS